MVTNLHAVLSEQRKESQYICLTAPIVQMLVCHLKYLLALFALNELVEVPVFELFDQECHELVGFGQNLQTLHSSRFSCCWSGDVLGELVHEVAQGAEQVVFDEGFV